jgi:ureidoglycolate dehydrogenase (NAD+)
MVALKSRSVREDVRQHVCESLIQTSLRGVDSHGLELLPHYIRAIDAGRINPDPRYRYTATAPSTGKLDADHTFGHAAGAEGMLKAIELARVSGMGAVAVYNSTHFGAAAYFSLLASAQNMIGMSFTHSTPHMLTYGGVRPFFSTNPICFSAPCQEEPFCLDMATTLATWNRLSPYRASRKQIPSDWACDAEGNPTTDPNQVAALLPIGGYKGFGLSMMVDILCSLLTGMPFGRNVTQMYAEPIGQKRYLGHFFMAIDIARFTDIDTFKKRLQEMMDAVRNEPAKDPESPIMVAGDPEKANYAIRTEMGIPVFRRTYEKFREIAQDIGFQGLDDHSTRR